MGNNLYWISALTYTFILVIVKFNDTKFHNKSDVDKAFNVLINWVIIFCLQDVIWGLCDSNVIKNSNVFFISSSIFHISTVLTTYFWLKYVLIFLKRKVRHKKNILLLDNLIILFQFALVIVNFFKPTIYSIFNGKYVTADYRALAFLNQYIVYLLIGITTLFFALREKHNKTKNRFLSVFFFSLMPILSGILQYLFPNAPFYSMGYFLGCFIIHIFVVSRDQIEAEQGITLRAIANIYYTMHMIDLKNNSVKSFLSSSIVNEYVNSKNKESLQTLMTNVMKATVTEKYLEKTLEFVDISTLDARLNGKSDISFEFLGKIHGWTRASFIPIEYDDKGTLIKVMFVTQIIDEVKRKELDLLYKSNSDQITGLLNRRAYEADIVTLLNNPNIKDLVYVSVDVNGLKRVNDNLGHAAGDELIIGAANCLKNSLGKYGEIYRVGGDEFISLIFTTEKELDIAKHELDMTISNWSGNMVKSLSLSCGYAPIRDYPTSTIFEISKIADKKMYETKAEYYKIHNIERRIN